MKRSPLKRQTPLRRQVRIRPINAERRAARFERNFGGSAHRAAIVRLPCCVPACRVPPPSDPHHIKTIGAGGDARHLVPLCRLHHQEFHRVGRVTFERRHRIQLAGVAERLWRSHLEDA